MEGETPKPRAVPAKAGASAGLVVLIALGAVALWAAIIALTAAAAWLGWFVSGTGTGAWIGGTVVFAVALALTFRSTGNNWLECGYAVFLVVVLGVIGYLAWLKYISEENHDATSWHRLSFTVVQTFAPQHTRLV